MDGNARKLETFALIEAHHLTILGNDVKTWTVIKGNWHATHHDLGAAVRSVVGSLSLTGPFLRNGVLP